MRLSVSNIAWDSEFDDKVLEYISGLHFAGLEIAPTRIIPNDPYNDLSKALSYASRMDEMYGLKISSMQSIWYGRNELIFRSESDRQVLLDYTKKLIDFASVMKCGNIVFGCPKNRIMGEEKKMEIAFDFFGKIAEWASEKNTIVSLEPNPVLYGTDFINTTEEAFEFIKKVKKPGLRVNLDYGTIVYNDETLDVIDTDFDMINHIHISEPNLLPVDKRTGHNELNTILKKYGYKGYVSLEMKRTDDIEMLKRKINYIYEVFG